MTREYNPIDHSKNIWEHDPYGDVPEMEELIEKLEVIKGMTCVSFDLNRLGEITFVFEEKPGSGKKIKVQISSLNEEKGTPDFENIKITVEK